MNWPERWCSRWSEKQTIKLDFIYNLRFRALLVSRRVTSWEERSLTQVGLPSSALNWRSVVFPTWTWLESGGRGWRATPGATRRSARKCSGWLQLEAQGHRLRDLDQAVVHLGSGCHVAIISFFCCWTDQFRQLDIFVAFDMFSYYVRSKRLSIISCWLLNLASVYD